MFYSLATRVAACCSSVWCLTFLESLSTNPVFTTSALSCILSCVLCVLTPTLPDWIIMTILAYTREELLECRAHTGPPPTDIPAELRKRRRGKRAGAKTRERRQRNRTRYKPCLPSVVMGNVRSLANKLDEITTLANSQREYMARHG